MSDLGNIAGKAGAKAEVRGTAAVATLSQWQLIRRRFSRHRLAMASLFMLAVLYTLALFAEFFSPYSSQRKDLDYIYSPPQAPSFSWRHGLHVHGVRKHVDPITFKKKYLLDADDIIPLRFFARGEEYKLWGLIPARRRCLGVDAGLIATRAAGRLADGAPPPVPRFYILGGDKYGRDIFSRIVFGARISLSVGLAAIVITFILGITIGGISGYLGGAVDNFIQRAIEILNSFPHLPLWLGLSAAVPPSWSPLRTYFAITIVLSLLTWTRLARVVRGKILALREEDYAMAARLTGAGHTRILFRHLLPGFTSHIIVVLTLTVPQMILGETSLSFLGLGLRPPIVSWGVMLQDCMNMQVVANYPWLLLPVVFIIVTVLCFNYVGDGLRDAADPYSAR